MDAVLFIGFLNAEGATTAANESSPASNVLNKSFVSVCEAGKDAYVFAGAHPWDMVAGRSEEPLHVGAVANQLSRVAWYSRNAGGDDLAGFIQAIRTRASAGGQISPEQ